MRPTEFVFISYLIFFVIVNLKKIHILQFIKSLTVLVVSTFFSLLYFIYFYLVFAFQTLSVISNGSSGKGFTNLLHYWLSLNTNSVGLIYSILNAGYILNEKLPTSWNWKWFIFYDSYPFFLIINSIIPIIALSSLFFLRRFKYSFKIDLYFIIFLLVIGLFAQSGLNGPTGFIYSWLFYHFSPIRAFDTPHLFYSPLTYLGYSILLAVTSYYFAHILIQKLNKKQVLDARKRVVKFLTFLVIVILILIPSYPIIDGSAVIRGYPSSEVQVPSYVTNVSNYLNAQQSEFNVLTLPLFESISQENYPKGGYYASTNPLSYLINDPLIGEIGDLSSIQASELSLINNAIHIGNRTTLLNLLEGMNIKYIVILGDYNSSSGIVGPFSMAGTLRTLNSTEGIIPIGSSHFYPYFLYKVLASRNLVYESISKHFGCNTSNFGSNLINDSVSYSFTNYSTNYTFHKFNFSNPSLLIDYNYTNKLTPNTYVMNINNLHINTNQYNYIAINYSTNDNNLTFEINRYTNNPEILPQIKTQNGVVIPLPPEVTVRYITFYWFPMNPYVSSNNSIYLTSVAPKLVFYYPYPILSDSHLITNLTFTNANISLNQNISRINILMVDYQSPTSISLKVTISAPTNFTLVLSNNYDPNWILNSQNALISRHIVVNGFMNAWILTYTKPGNYTILITYKEQNLSYDLQLVSLLSTIFFSSYFSFYSYRKRSKNKIPK